jgi:hypothetical protein
MALQPFVGPWPLLQFRNLCYTDGKTPWASDQPVARPLPTHRTTKTQNKRHTQTSMPWVGFEPTILASERAKAVHDLECATTVIGTPAITGNNFFCLNMFSMFFFRRFRTEAYKCNYKQVRYETGESLAKY